MGEGTEGIEARDSYENAGIADEEEPVAEE